jgi:hypothetical protein
VVEAVEEATGALLTGRRLEQLDIKKTIPKAVIRILSIVSFF